MNNLTIYLFDAAGIEAIDSTKTDSLGNYRFEVETGQYYLLLRAYNCTMCARRTGSITLNLDSPPRIGGAPVDSIVVFEYVVVNRKSNVVTNLSFDVVQM